MHEAAPQTQARPGQPHPAVAGERNTKKALAAIRAKPIPWFRVTLWPR